MRRVIWMWLALAAIGCGSDGETGMVEGLSPQLGQSYLAAEAIEELSALGVVDYRGKAVVTGSSENGAGVTKLTYDPASGPICLRGGIFSLFYEDRGSDKTMLVLDGGGACWSSLCQATETVEDDFTPRGPASNAPDNYFNDWNIVFVPYCDGSVFAGDNDFIEMDGSTRFHHGRQNLAAALDLMASEFGDSTKIMITGFSAGGYGTMSAMIATRLQFPLVDLYVVNDSGPGVQNPALIEATEERMNEWKYHTSIPESCTACDGGRGQQVALYDWMLARDPNVKISVLSYYSDQVIGRIFNGYKMEGEYKALLLTETDPIHTAYPDRFKRYMLPGMGHVVTGMWNMLTADGVAVKDWVSAMAQDDGTVWVDLLAEGP